MKIELLHDYRGRITGEQLLSAGVLEVDDGLGAYLVANGHALEIVEARAKVVVLEAPAEEDAVYTEYVEDEAPKKRGRR